MRLVILVLLLVCLRFVLYTVYIFFRDEWKMRESAPYVGSYISHKKLLKQSRDKIQGKYVLDMGCGDGGILRFFIKNMAFHRGDGYDIRAFPIRFGKILNNTFGYNRISLYHDDFLNAEIQKYDTLYLFLWPSVIDDIEKHIQDTMHPNTVVITNTFHFKNRLPYDVIRNEKGKIVFQLYKKVHNS